MTDEEKERFEFALKREQKNHEILYDTKQYSEYVKYPPWLKERNKRQLQEDIVEAKKPTNLEIDVYFGGNE